MKFNKIRLVGATNVDLPIVGADPAGPYVLKSSDGLGPPPREVKIARTIREGGVRQGTRTANRQIVTRVGLQPEWDIGQTAEELRTELYGLLTPKFGQPVLAQLMLGNAIVAQSQGDISTFEVALFAKDPEVQIALDCDYSYLLAPAVQNQNPAKSVVSGKTAIDIDNAGTAPAGFWMGITLQSAQAGDIQISENSVLGETMSIGGDWEAGDTLIVDTRAGLRGVWQIKSGFTTKKSVLNNLESEEVWLELHGGDNRLLINNTAFDWYQAGFTHTPAYWGV